MTPKRRGRSVHGWSNSWKPERHLKDSFRPMCSAISPCPAGAYRPRGSTTWSLSEKRSPRPRQGAALAVRSDAGGVRHRVEERWKDGGHDWYAREMARAEVIDGAVSSLSVYCTGDWDENRRIQHAGEVTLSRS